MRLVLTWFPFVSIIALNSLAVAAGYRLRVLAPLLLAIAAVTLLNLVVAAILKITHYFTYAVGGVTLLGIAATFVVPAIGQWFVENAIAGLYAGLLLAALVPPLLGMRPFTYEFSRGSYPRAIVESEQFRRVNLTINRLWAGLFGLAIVLTVIPYTEDGGLQVVLSSLVPIVVLLAVGLPMTTKLPAVLIRRTPGERLHFESVGELFEAMPLGLNRDRAAGIDSTTQFHLSGEEPLQGYLTIKDGRCTFDKGVHPSPTTVIRADSGLWLAISNNEISGDWAYLNDKYECEGDLTILLQLQDLFAPPAEEHDSPLPATPFEYGSLPAGAIRRVVVFDGGPRSDRFSKTAMMARQFCDGARSAGADVEYISLRRKQIEACTGCYSCWTKTPGECVFDDDMTELRRAFRQAELVVLATPLYIFSATGRMKTFLDRLLPNMQPYMQIDPRGHTLHPHRYAGDPAQGLVVFSAAGFPDVEDNFDGLRGMVRCMGSHFEKSTLLAEFYLPGAELLAQPVYAERLTRVRAACRNAGAQVIREGRIDRRPMDTVSDPGVTPRRFQEGANHFWETMDGKGAFLRQAPQLPAEKGDDE